MRRNHLTQSLSYPIHLPDVVQADALRLLDVSREVINATLTALWDQLDAFGVRETPFAYKQVTAMIGSSDPHVILMGTGNGAAKPNKQVASCVRKRNAKSGLLSYCPFFPKT